MEKKIIMGTLIGGAAYFLLGWLIYGVILKDFYDGQVAMQGVYKEIPDFPFLVLGNLIGAYLLTLIVGKWTNAVSAAEGAKTGLLFGLLIGASFDFTMYATSNIMTLNGAFVDIVVTGVMTAIVGAVIASVTSKTAKTT